MEEKFVDILNEGEELNKVLKPNRFVFIWEAVLSELVGLIMFGLFAVFGIFMMGSMSGGEQYILLIPVGLFVIAMVITLIFRALLYKNTFYAITNKRLIIRSGIFGIDYKSIDLSDISAVEPRVSIWEKVAGKHTGSILVGSPTRPILGYSNSSNAYGGGSFKFGNVNNPYDVAKEIKELADKAKGVQQRTSTIQADKGLVEQVKELDELRKSGAITETEYQKMKEKLMKDL